MDLTPWLELAKSGGSVLVALVILGGLLYAGHRLIWLPSQKQTRAIAESNRDAAKFHKDAAEAHERAARFNATTTEANSRTADALAKMMDRLLA